MVEKAWDEVTGVLMPDGMLDLAHSLQAIVANGELFGRIRAKNPDCHSGDEFAFAAIRAWVRIVDAAKRIEGGRYAPQMSPANMVRRLADVQELLLGTKDPDTPVERGRGSGTGVRIDAHGRVRRGGPNAATRAWLAAHPGAI